MWAGQGRVTEPGDGLRQAVLGDRERALAQVTQGPGHRPGDQPGEEHPERER
jgi:hypothetical protein